MIKPEDEFRHACPAEAKDGLWGDTLWVSVVDPAANIFGINHFHLTNKGYARYEALYVIDGVQQLYGNKIPLGEKPDRGPWSDGRLSYEVVKPLEEIRIAFDGPRYGFDLRFTGRFPVFDYADSVRGNPLARFHSYGGHYEQGLQCRGSFEIRGGPCKGEVRKLDSFAHRDHSWSTRFAEEPPWEPVSGNRLGHFWPSIQLADKHINAFGVIDALAAIATDGALLISLVNRGSAGAVRIALELEGFDAGPGQFRSAGRGVAGRWFRRQRQGCGSHLGRKGRVVDRGRRSHGGGLSLRADDARWLQVACPHGPQVWAGQALGPRRERSGESPRLLRAVLRLRGGRDR